MNTELINRAERLISGLDKSSGGMKVAEYEHPELKELDLSELLGRTADFVRELVIELRKNNEK